MKGPSPFKIAIYSKGQDRRGWIGDPTSVVFTPRHNAPGSVEVTVSSSHNRLPDVMAPGARAVVEYQGVRSGEDPERISGPIRAIRGQGPAGVGLVTFTVEDDKRLLWRVLGWPVPANPINGQSTAEYWRGTGPAETILKDAVRANAQSRLGMSVDVAPDLGRGATIPGGVSIRMHPLADRLFPAVEQAGLGVTVVQDGPEQQGTGFRVDVYEPRAYPRALTEAGGTVVDWSWNRDAPAVTRVVAGGQGEGTARTFRRSINADLEAEWGDVIEGFVDARDAEDDATIDARAATALQEGAPTAGLAVTLAETGTFRYGGKGIRVGDTVTARVGVGTEITDLLREASIVWAADTGLSVTPVVGEITDDPDRAVAEAIAALARNQRGAQSSR